MTATQPSAAELVAMLREARQRTLALVADLDDEQLMGPKLAIVNPLLWEIGHVAWFQEKWSLRHLKGEPPLEADADALYDSMAIDHDTRWDLPLWSRSGTLAYMDRVLGRVVEGLERSPELSAEEVYFHLLPLFHEDMHDEAFVYTRQTHGWPAPAAEHYGPRIEDPGGALPGDVEVEGGTFLLGASPDAPFAFDNEKWAHPVEVAPFRIARAAVTQGELREFVDDGGYEREELWSEGGRAWRRESGARHPVYWRRDGGGYERRVYDRWVDLEDDLPAVHVSWWEAEAYCRWAGRRLPTEAEWELAASGGVDGGRKRTYPWGEESDATGRANLDGSGGGTVPVGALAAGDSPCGCRQMLGNVWEWTGDDFGPFPGFVPDPYKEYSEPWFGDHKVLRGGCWATRLRLVRNTWRNFYQPQRRDVWAGFRTCAL